MFSSWWFFKQTHLKNMRQSNCIMKPRDFGVKMDKKYLKLPPGNGPVFKMYVQVGLGGVFLNITFVNRPANWGIDS